MLISGYVWGSSFSKQACKPAQIDVVEKEYPKHPDKTEQRL